jgi:hypothetical protein
MVRSLTNLVAGYTPWVNTLDYTAAVFPVTKVDPAIDLVEVDYTPLNDLDKAIHEECKSSLFSLVRHLKQSLTD